MTFEKYHVGLRRLDAAPLPPSLHRTVVDTAIPRHRHAPPLAPPSSAPAPAPLDLRTSGPSVRRRPWPAGEQRPCTTGARLPRRGAWWCIIFCHLQVPSIHRPASRERLLLQPIRVSFVPLPAAPFTSIPGRPCLRQWPPRSSFRAYPDDW
ncbi:hypothetical protein BS50DRAFT_10024 [Corynespora cassiicola Philippines]|uniref:Uncharacterized protein n=1 Tax=Corynespora cassiicola Philippines TaxID=1448308 RepID=A0A2T2P959_CORCC|nr:hypothetical protein BS50DRAFT_10024 [Corynespora cassiicola Philippines]